MHSAPPVERFSYRRNRHQGARTTKLQHERERDLETKHHRFITGKNLEPAVVDLEHNGRERSVKEKMGTLAPRARCTGCTQHHRSTEN